MSANQSDPIKRFKLEEKLGEGASGNVFKAIDLYTNDVVAIKKIPFKSHIQDKIKKEIEIMKKLPDNPYIVKYITSFKTACSYHIVMEYMNGGELYKYLVKNYKDGMPEKMVQRLTGQLVSALKYCHGNMVAHRDLKLENILVKNDKGKIYIKLADFGLSKILPTIKRVNTSCGSLLYAAPEVILSKPNNLMETDIWSLGVVIFAMLTGQFPWASVGYSDFYVATEITRYQWDKSSKKLSFYALDIFERIFVPGTFRISLSELRYHPWLKPYVKNVRFATRKIKKINCSIIKDVVNMSFKEEEVLLAVYNNTNTTCNAIYHSLRRVNKSKRRSNVIDCRVVRKVVKLGFDICTVLTTVYNQHTSQENKVYHSLRKAIEKSVDKTSSKSNPHNIKKLNFDNISKTTRRVASSDSKRHKRVKKKTHRPLSDNRRCRRKKTTSTRRRKKD